MIRAATLLLIVASAACSRNVLHEPQLVQSVEQETISVKKPMVIGFYSPRVGGDEHLDWGLENTAACLSPKGVKVIQVSANVLVLVDGKTRSQFVVPSEGNEGLGCYMVAPGRKPLIVNSVAPSYLVHACPGAAAVYFGHESCCPKDWVCCPDGSLRTMGESCDS